MESGTLLRKIHMNCPLCDQLHEVEERERISTMMIKDEEVTYTEHFYFCVDSDEEENEFETGSMANENDFDTEFLDYTLAVKVVSDVDAAIDRAISSGEMPLFAMHSVRDAYWLA